MLLVSSIVGHHGDAVLHDILHQLEHDGLVDFVSLSADDASRHRLRVVSDGGVDLAISLDRDETLRDGSVLVLEPGRAIVVRLGSTDWCRLTPRDSAAALELGHRAGHLHWRVRFDGDVLLVAADSGRPALLARITDLVDSGRVAIK